MQMNGKHLLDTNIIVALFKNDDDVRNHIAASRLRKAGASKRR